jgi:hypothetical protein
MKYQASVKILMTSCIPSVLPTHLVHALVTYTIPT